MGGVDLLSLFKKIKRLITPQIVYSAVDNGIVDFVKRFGMMYGVCNDKFVDLYVIDRVTDDVLMFLKKYFVKYILTKDMYHFDGYRCIDGMFSEYGLYLFEKEGLIKVCAFPMTNSKDNAVVWYRLELPLTKVWLYYYDIHPKIVFPPNFFEFLWCDIFIFQRYMEGFYSLMKYCKSLGKKVIYETDDLDIYISRENPLYNAYMIGNVMEQIKNMLSIADVVTVTTENMKKELSIFNDNIVVLRNKIDFGMTMWNCMKKKNERINIMWAGGSTHYYDLQLIKMAIAEVCRRFEKVYFCLGGYTKGGKRIKYYEDKETGIVNIMEEELERGVWDDLVDEFRSLIGDKLIVYPALPIDRYGELYKDADIVVIPLKDNKFSRGKSELKVLEAGAYGIPVVVSGIPPYTEIVRHGENGFLVVKQKEWVKYLMLLIQNEELRRRIGENLYNYVRANYDVNNQDDRVSLFRMLYEKKDESYSGPGK